jgi:hypothetical protein
MLTADCVRKESNDPNTDYQGYSFSEQALARQPLDGEPDPVS